MPKKRTVKKFRSKFEKLVHENLQEMKAGSLVSYESEKIPYTLEGKYIPDWVVKKTGTILEAKGKLDYETRRKMLAVRDAHPDRRICLVFMRANNKLYKGSKTTYADWAQANGFDWSDGGKIKKEWLR